MRREILFVGYTEDEAKSFIKNIVKDCLNEYKLQMGNEDQQLTVRQACKFMSVSAPTLRRYVQLGYIRRHDLGPKKKYFYLSELKEDIKSISSPQ
jgi:hypothetical protein